MKDTLKQQTKPNWFKGAWYSSPEEVTNPFSGESCLLTGAEASMYDFIMGSQIVLEMGMIDNPKMVEDLRKGLEWFRINNSKAYMVLLD